MNTKNKIINNKTIIEKGKSETIISQKVVNTLQSNYEIILEENSKLNYVELGEEIIDTKITLKKNAELNYYILTLDNRIQKNVLVELNENSKINMKNIILSENTPQTQNHNIRIVHIGKNSSSKLENKAILSNSNLQIKGNIVIEKKADEADGYQKSEILIFKNSKAISIPDLEIKNNNVKCTHSASITKLDDEKIFYLMTRGISQKDAIELLMNSFVHDDIIGINEEEKTKIYDLIKEKISSMEKVK
jgi:Fe-S cluster assembly scaffold protein SufB